MVLFTLSLRFLFKKWHACLTDSNHAVTDILPLIGMFVIIDSSTYLSNRISLHRHYRPKSGVST